MAQIHIHTKYSLLDAIIEPEELVKSLKENGETALCVTEHGNLYSSIEIYKLCQKYNIKYLHGCEMYICDDITVKDKGSKYHHLILISKNETGRLNLIQLVSQSCNYKYYGKPRIDFEMLEKYHEGLICVSACMAGEIQRALYENDLSLAKKIALKYKKVFNDDYYLEYQSHSSTEQQQLNRQVVDLANELDIDYIVTTDAHYLHNEDKKYHSIFVQIGQAREVGETYNDCYVQTKDEILKICQSTTQEENLRAIKNTNIIADKCNVTIPLSDPIMTHVNVPSWCESEIQYLIEQCKKGWKDRKINKNHCDKIEEYKSRLKYEIDTIREMGFEGYYLFVWSYANSVKRRGIARGSGGGSLVAYLANIVDIDPIEYGLYFERFIDVGALSLLREGKITKAQLKIPDFDLDFGKADRKKVLDYVVSQYGKDNVANLGSFQYIWAKGAIKDIGKVLGIPFEITNEMTSQLDKETIDEVIELGLLDKYKKTYPELFDYASKLAGLPKSFSAHPCGKVVCMKPVTYYNATDLSKDGEVTLQGDMHTAEDLGLIKADFLGLRTVDVIYDTLESINKDYDYIAPHNIDLKDELVYQNFRDGNTKGIFQFESDGMKSVLKNINCDSIYDLTVANALYRPGSMKFIDNYANRRNGTETFEYLHPDLEPILKDSYGIIIFQEQLIEIGRMAGLSNPDELRKATAKKKPELLNKIKPELTNGLLSRGWTESQIDELWEIMLDFAKYSFNKSHAAAYALIAYITMFLKVHHSKEFACAWINSVSDKIEKVSICLSEIKNMGIPIYLGKYNDCNGKSVVYKDGVMIGLSCIKNCNSQIASELMALSKNHYNNFFELIAAIQSNTSVNFRQLKILTGLNFFEDFGKNKYLLSLIDIYDKFATCKQIKKSQLEDLGLTEYLMQKYAKTETKALYKDLDNIGIMNEMSHKIPNKPMGIIEHCRFEKEYLEYVTYTCESANEEYYIVVDFIQGKDPTKPRMVLHNIKTGEEVKSRIKQNKYFKESPFGLYSVLRIKEFSQEFKKKPNAEGEWIVTDEIEDILKDYEVIK